MITKDIETELGIIKVRGLRRGEIKQMKADGFYFGAAIPMEKMEAQTAAALKFVMPDDLYARLDEFMEADLLKVHKAIIDLTYPTEEQGKN